MTEDELVDLEITLGEVGNAGVSLREIRDLIAEVRRLRKALKRYGSHECAPDFVWRCGTRPCPCGLDDALDGK